MKHPALNTETWKKIQKLKKENKAFAIHNQYGETKICMPGTNFYENELRQWFKVSYDLDEIMTVTEL